MDLIFNRAGYKQVDASSLVRDDGNYTQRMYVDTAGETYISCTSLLSMYEDHTNLIAWQERLGIEEAAKVCKEAADRGTLAHECVEDYLNSLLAKAPTPLIASYDSPFAKQALESFYKLVEPIKLEAAVCFNDSVVRFAGTFDQMVKIPADTFHYANGEAIKSGVVLVDLKTKAASKGINQSYIFKHLLQLSSYVVAEELATGVSIDGIVIVFAYPRSSKKVYLPRTSVTFYWNYFYSLLLDYFEVQELKKDWDRAVLESSYAYNDTILDFESHEPLLFI